MIHRNKKIIFYGGMKYGVNELMKAHRKIHQIQITIINNK